MVWEGDGENEKTIAPSPPVSFLLTVPYPLGTDLFFSPGFCCCKIKDGSLNFHRKNTEHSLALLKEFSFLNG